MRIVVASRKPVWITLAAALVFHTLLLSLQTGQRMNTGFLRTILLDSLAPLEKVVDGGVEGAGGIWQRYFWLIGVHDENQQLQAEIARLRQEIAVQKEEVLEARRLRRLLGLRDIGLGKTVVARVIGRDPSQAHQTITIDKGTVHGVRPDSAAVTPDGVAGRVIYAANLYSVVQLVVDAQSAVGVLVGPDRRQGIVKGTGGHELQLDYIDDDSAIQEGDQLVTSGLDRIYPKGLALGRVSHIGPRSGLLGMRGVSIVPSVDLGRIEEVICIVEPMLDTGDPADMPPAASESE